MKISVKYLVIFCAFLFLGQFAFAQVGQVEKDLLVVDEI